MAVKLTIYPPRQTSPEVVEFNEDRVTIGRSSQCDIRLPFRVVSGHHLTIHHDERSGFQVRDEASTNGTLLDGEPMPIGEDRRLRSGVQLEIVDLRITVELVPTLGDGLSLDKTGTMVRQMVGEALLMGTDSDEDERTYFEVLRGASCGQRLELPDDLDRGVLADRPDAAIFVPGLATSIEIYRDGDGFAVRLAEDAPADPPVSLGGEPLEDGHKLTSGDVLRVGSTELEFVDPLESYLAELEGLVPAEGDANSADDANPIDTEAVGELSADGGDAVAETLTEAKSPESAEDLSSGSSWGVLEVGVLLVSLMLLLGVGYLLSSVFGLL